MPRFGRTFRTILLICFAVFLLVEPTACGRRRIRPDEEAALRTRLVTLREVIAEYSYDKKKPPQSLKELVRDGYIREIPIDPITRSNRTWRVASDRGITRISSGSDRKSSDGKRYSSW